MIWLSVTWFLIGFIVGAVVLGWLVWDGNNIRPSNPVARLQVKDKSK